MASPAVEKGKKAPTQQGNPRKFYLPICREGSETDKRKIAEETEVQQKGENLVAGIIGKSGDVLDESGSPVGKVTEGDASDLAGSVVTATGDIIGKKGGVLGHAEPLDDKKTEDGGFSLMGAAKGIKAVVDPADGTVKTISQGLPVLDALKGLGGKGESEAEGAAKGAEGVLGGVLGEKPEERDVGEKEQMTEEAKKKLFEETDKAAEAAPVEVKDQEPAETRSQPPESEAGEAGESKAEAPSGPDTKAAEEKGEEVAEEAPEKKGEEVAEEAPEAEGVSEKAEEAAEGAPEEAEKKAEEAKGAPEELEKEAEGAPEELEKKGEEAPEELEKKTDEAPEGVPEAAETKAEEAKGAPEELEKKAEEAPEELEKKEEEEAPEEELEKKAEEEAPEGAAEEEGQPLTEAAKSQLDEMETVEVPGEMLPAPFQRFEDAEIDDEGKVIYENESIGKVVEGKPEDLAGRAISPGGAVRDDEGSEIGRVELKSEIAREIEEEVKADLSVLKGLRVNKGGNLVNDKNMAIGRVKSGVVKQLVGRKSDELGRIWNDSGEVIGECEVIPEKEREEFKEPAPFEDFPDATVQSNGDIVSKGEVIGKLVDGDPKKLKGKTVDEEGDVQDRQGNVLGHAERWEPEEPEPEAEIDKSILAGKRINKAGFAVDSSGNIFGRVSEGSDIKKLRGRMCNKKGEVISETGDVLGTVDLVPEADREGAKEGPFADLGECTVRKDGMVMTKQEDIVGRLVEGDPKVLFGRLVDEDGEVLDRNGNSIGKAERWEPEAPPEKAKGPMEGRRVNKQGEVYDDDHNLMGKLTSGDLNVCAGKEIDGDNDVVDSKGATVGHVSLLEDIPAPEETPEEKEAREKAEKDEKLAQDLAGVIEQGLDKIRPICNMITDKIDKAERTPKEELDEEELVKQVKPLIEEGGKILSEMNGSIRGMDPDGRIQRNAKQKAGSRDATPGEYHLADVLKELTGTVTTCIDSAKRKIEDMPHAKKELNPLWGLLTEPLFQILAAVGLLLAGVLNLVGRLLSGLGLGGLVDGLLGTLGLNRLLDSLGVGSLLGGKKKK
ncbi:hypothetical protein SODALDRAFT_287967 [Sodiomyces alkalinus F11]|uniref:DUF6987 domain-containing protein n=1 Tax=Sodiomyces alkalinus (strain CBS 110278 / VKM F-3762 / F11) TaxID=1314773 RepID=A0A3N2Q771_SODAK|nr:hypothetical protein SODALDRAFT_287967 [Sodiomyces alkalinus F11]ROT42600.1 hypothetical protein SODALDRAFT_287967 [Sodiomyces alkalinus F11]